MNQLLEDLARGGISIVTRLDDGSVGAHFVIQIDGDVMNSVSPQFLTDAAARDRHSRAIAAALGQWNRARSTVRAILAITAVTLVSLLVWHPSWKLLAASLVLSLAIRWCIKLVYKKAIGAVLNHEPPDVEPSGQAEGAPVR